MFGHFFTSYDEANEKYQRIVKRKKGGSAKSKTRRRISKLIERSFFVNAVPKFIEALLRLSLRDYGIIMFIMGAMMAVSYPLRENILFLNTSVEMLVVGIALCVCAIPMLFSSKSISYNIYNSKMGGSLFFGFLGLNAEKMREASEKEKISLPNITFFVGVVLGALSYVISPLQLLSIIALFILGYCVLRAPEIGVVVTILALPYISTIAMQCCILYVFVCYMLKCIVGKRTFKFEFFDIWVVLVMLLVFARGSISSDIMSSMKESFTTLCLILSYFLVTNLIRTKEWFRRCLISLVMTGVVVAVIAIGQVIIGRISTVVPDLNRLFTNGQSATSSFYDANVLSHFLLAIIPFSFVHMMSERKGKQKLLGFMICTLLVVAMGFTHSLSGVVGLVCAILLLLIFFDRNFTYLAFITIAACPILYFTLPDSAFERIVSTKMLSGLSIYSWVEEIREGFRLVIENPLGVGTGESIFKATFGADMPYSSNILVQSLLEYGVIGFVVFVAFALMLMRLTFSYCVKAKNEYRRINCCAGFCAVTGLVTAGIIDYSWYDKRIVLLFWLLVAFPLHICVWKDRMSFQREFQERLQLQP